MIDMTLNVVPGGPTPAGSVLRAKQAYLELMGVKVTLDCGIAFLCEDVPGYREGQQFREVMVEDPAELAPAFAAAEAHFAEHDARCSRWALAEAQDPAAIEPFLTERGFRRHDVQAVALTAWPEQPAHEAVRILPARPMRAAYIQCWESAMAYLPEDAREAAVAAAVERLDDHRMDSAVATVDGVPAGVGALFQVGDIGLVADFYVVPGLRRRGVGSALLHHAIALARRLMMRLVCAEVPLANPGGLAFLQRHGFVDGGRFVEFLRDDMPAPDYASW
ncbi:MAG: GNAT family N-acetyltransferase [Phycisphaerales bacterium]|nr:GNAT family N-acetyltransferase [Phycisphaerales bacterium]